MKSGLARNSADYQMVKAFKLQLETNLGSNSFAKWVRTFPELDLPSVKIIRRQMRRLSGLVSIRYDCCRNVCICFYGPYAHLQICPTCQQPRYDAKGRPVHQFHYIPIIPQLCALYAGKTSALAMLYRSRHHKEVLADAQKHIDDIYDADHYQWLLTQNVVVDGVEFPYKYLSDPRDVLLVGLTDGFQLWKRSEKTSWPLLFLNGNLDPTSARFKFGSVIGAGIIPGPKKPKDFDSFLRPFVDEMHSLARGVKTFDAHTEAMFTLRAYAPFGCGDMPACATAWSGCKNHGAEHPCRACHIGGVRIKGTKNLSYYVPLTRPPGYPPSPYSITNLPPLRNNTEFLAQANEIESATTAVQRKRLSQQYGINRLPLTASLPGWTFPWSIPFDLMHLLENTCKNMLLLVFGCFKGMDAGTEDYIIPDAIAKEIAQLTVHANRTVPSAFGRPIPNPFDERSFFTAEAWVAWTTLYAPILLRNRFTRPKYYNHFVLFVSIINRLANTKTSRVERTKLREDINKWYDDLEK